MSAVTMMIVDHPTTMAAILAATTIWASVLFATRRMAAAEPIGIEPSRRRRERDRAQV